MTVKEILDIWDQTGILPFTSRNTPGLSFDWADTYPTAGQTRAYRAAFPMTYKDAYPPGRHLIDIIKGNQVQQTTPVRRKYLLETMGISDYSYKLISTTMGYIPPLNQ